VILLRTLGLTDVAAAGHARAREVLAQPKRFAFLVYLLLARPRGWQRRDALLARFWPETDQVQGRQVLRQTVYLLRQQLGPKVIEGRGKEELAANRELVSCDVETFEESLAQGRTAQALEQYHGDFLAGLHVPDASPELEEWITAERQRLRRLARDAARALRDAEEGAGHAAAAAFWAHRAATLDPLDERGAQELMELLARQGDGRGAVEVYDELARRLKQELEAEPGAALKRLADSLRTSSRTVPPGAVPSAPPSAPAPPTPTPSPAPGPSRAGRRRAAVMVGAALLALAVLAGGWALWSGRRNAARQPLLAVGPITTVAEGDTSRVSSVVADLLSTSLARMSTLHVIPLARLYEIQSQLRSAGVPDTTMLGAAAQAGAAELMQGTVHRLAGGGLQLDLEVTDLSGGAVLRAYRATGADVFSMVDDATTLVARGYGVPSPPQRIADVTTQSIVAYRLYEEGLQAYRREDPAVAYRLFLAALQEDSTFAMAVFYSGLTAPLGVSPYPLWVRAARLAGHATDRERLMILEWVANNIYSPAVDAVAETLAVRYPEDPYARMALADVHVHRGEWAAAAAEYRRAIEMDSLSLVARPRTGPSGGTSGVCVACEAYVRLWLTQVYANSLPEAVRVAREVVRRQPGMAAPHGILASALGRMGRVAEAAAEFRTADSLHRGTVALDLELALLALRSGAFAQADSQLRGLMHDRSQDQAGEAGWFLILSLRAQGRWREALALARTRAQSPSLQEGTTLLEMGRSREAAAFYRDWDRRLERDPDLPGFYAKQHAWMLTHVASCLAAAGDTAELPPLADSVAAVGSRSAFGRDPLLHHFVRGLLWRARGDLSRAAVEFRASIWSWTDGYTRENYELARALIELGRPLEAISPLQAALQGDLQSSNLYITRTELHELLAEAFERVGQRDSAAAHYRAVVDAWRNADPNVRDRWTQARDAVARLTGGTTTSGAAGARPPGSPL
jgi:DNA-binding SARP family transcriptional activator/tetratricopeptide (TPR) repeat protein